ncbi:MAG: response regulator [Ignavibacteriales bacterium]|nr:response regulator [Ignavibacteriales bacterium]
MSEDVQSVAPKRMNKGSNAPMPTVLVVDDDKNILEAFRIFLESENCRMLASMDVDDAMEKARNNKVDLLITDFYLKTKSSVELYTLIRKVFPEIPIAVITGYPEYIGETDAKVFGADYYFTKPLELNKMREVVRNACFPKSGE